jgi:hypothetical protein
MVKVKAKNKIIQDDKFKQAGNKKTLVSTYSAVNSIKVYKSIHF